MQPNLISWLFGYISGFLILITGSTLNFWLAAENFELSTISLFALVSLPYAFNFLWSPIFDYYQLSLKKGVPSRVNWLVILQLSIAISLLVISSLDPLTSPRTLAVVTTLVAFFSASQDSVLNALRSEILAFDEQKTTAGMYIFGYRIGMTLSGTVAIFASNYLSWHVIYLIFSIIVLLFPVLIVYYTKKNTNLPEEINYSKYICYPFKISELKAMVAPLGSKKFILLLMVFLTLYRLADNFIYIILNSFLLDIGFTSTSIAFAGKLCGTCGAILGSLAADYILKRITLTQGLYRFGIAHCLTHICYISLAKVGNNIILLFVSTVCESITGGMMMTAYIALITCLCKGKYRATQYSLMSAVMGFSRSIVPSIAALVAASVSWEIFFFIVFILSLPGIYILRFLIPHFNGCNDR